MNGRTKVYAMHRRHNKWKRMPVVMTNVYMSITSSSVCCINLTRTLSITNSSYTSNPLVSSFLPHTLLHHPLNSFLLLVLFISSFFPLSEFTSSLFNPSMRYFGICPEVEHVSAGEPIENCWKYHMLGVT